MEESVQVGGDVAAGVKGRVVRVQEWGWAFSLKRASGSTTPLTPVFQGARERKRTSERTEDARLRGCELLSPVRQQEPHSKCCG